MRLLFLLLALFLAVPRLAAQAVSGPASATTNAVPSYLDNKHLKDNPLVTIVGGHIYIAGAPVLTNAPAGITFAVNGTSSSAPNLTNTATLVIDLTSTNVTFWPTNLTDAQIATAAAIAQSKISGLVTDLAAKIANSSGTGTNTVLQGTTLGGSTTNSGVGATKVVVTDSAGVETGATLSGLSLVGTALSTTENGTVTSVAMTVPSQFAVSGSPITTSGTLAVTLTNSTGTGKVTLDTDPSLTRPALAGATWSGSTTNSSGTASRFLTLDSAKVVSTTGASADLAATLSDESGTGLAVFGTDPSLTRPAIAGATISGTTTNTSTFSGTFTNTGAMGVSGAVTLGSTLSVAGNETFATDNSFDIGATAATRPRTLYLGTSQYIQRDALGVTPTDVFIITNSTASATNAQQYSGAIRFDSFGFGTTAGTSQDTAWRIYNQPVQATVPTANLLFDFSVAGGAFANKMTMSSGGALTVGSIGASGASLGLRGSSVGTAWNITTSGHLVAQADNTYDIGASGTTRPRNLYVAGTSTLSGAVTAPSIVVTNATTTGTLTVGGGTSILKVISATATLDFPNTLAQTDSDLTITLTGVALGDVVDLGVPNGSTQAGSCFSAWVSAANTVTVRFSVYGLAAKDPASGTFRVAVTQF